MRLDEVVAMIDPSHTSLFLGAGASIASGAPTGAQLSQFLAARLSPPPDGGDLAEICGIFENRLGRRALVDAIRERLSGLAPTQGMLALPSFPWKSIYSTNFDRLVESAYRMSGTDLKVVRSNYDFSPPPKEGQPVLYKVHGCITQDVADGSRARMLLTESDYDDFDRYRLALFRSLELAMLTSHTVIIGQSLADAHLRQLAKDVGALRSEGATGRIFLLVYQYDQDRAQLFEQRGISVAKGTLEDFLHKLSEKRSTVQPVHTTSTVAPRSLTPSLASVTTDVAHAASLIPNPVKLFNGAPATYADIRAGLTIPRAIEARLDDSQKKGVRGYFLVLAGAAGVGKTSLARRMMHRRAQEGFAAWEHNNSYPLDVEGWVETESRLREARLNGVLLIDDCAQHMAAVNRLADALGAIDRPFLRLVLTVNSAQWKTRTKSSYFFSRGSIERLSTLTDPDISELISLVDRESQIKALVEEDFLTLGRHDKVRRLRDRCSADMFVCLKNLFHSESLDTILLQEYADLAQDARDVYRHVAALQAMGARVHRQLIMRLLSVDAGGVQALLAAMEDVVEEYDVSSRDGLYGWSTRHDVIARTVATYKYADQEELTNLLKRLIDGLNPTVYMELETARAIASHDMGIQRVMDPVVRVSLLERLIAVVPGERTPRRRLIRQLLDQGRLAEADRAISVASRDLGRDDIVERYRAILALYRSEQTPGLLPEDRYAMLLEAERIARDAVTRQRRDRFNYRTLADIGLAFAERFGEFRIVDDVIVLMRAVEAEVADPDFAEERRAIETRRRRVPAPGVV